MQDVLRKAEQDMLVESGVTLVTGHDHLLTVEPWVDYRNVWRWGVRTGMLAASPYEAQFVNYVEAKRPRWGSGLIALRIVKGQLLWSQVVRVVADGVVDYQGHLIEV